RAFGEGRGDRIGLGEIGAEEAPVGAGSRRLALDLGDPRLLETRVVIVVETVETDHRVTTLQQPARDMEADEPGRPGDENPHLSWRRRRPEARARGRSRNR